MRGVVWREGRRGERGGRVVVGIRGRLGTSLGGAWQDGVVGRKGPTARAGHKLILCCSLQSYASQIKKTDYSKVPHNIIKLKYETYVIVL